MIKNKIGRGDICLVDFGNVTGSEQGGIRPAVIVQNDVGNKYSPCTIVCPITSKIKNDYLPTHLKVGVDDGLKKESIILCEQVQTIDKERIKECFGKIENQNIINELNKKLLVSLGIED